MRINEAGLNLIKQCEGLRLTTYLDAAGVPTIGYGHTKGVRMGSAITQEEANKYLLEDIESAERKVNAINETGKYHFTDNEFSALVSFCFNIGSVVQLTGNGKKSKDEIRRDLPLYCKATVNGKKVTLKGLQERRKKELALFNTPSVVTFNAVVEMVISGKLGNGATRKKNVESYGFNYGKVQAEVNKRLREKNVSRGTSYSFDEVVKMCIAGKLGNGATRKKNVEKMGYTYKDVQSEVNRRLRKK